MWSNGKCRMRRDRRGFTGVELMVVLVVVSILGGSIAGTRVYLKTRAAEQTVKNDVQTYAQMQMAARAQQGTFAPHATAVAAGFDWSDKVQLSTVRVDRDRFFVRARHSQTGYTCAIDMAPSSRAARNRMVCAGSVADPAVAEPSGVIVGPAIGDTVSVSRPTRPPEPPKDPSLLVSVGDLADLVMNPGASTVVSFPVTNRGSLSYPFSFATTSTNLALVPNPPTPASAHINADETAPIPVSISLASGTRANESAHVELRASNPRDGGRHANGYVRVRVALVVAAPTVTAPPAQTRDAGEEFDAPYQVTNNTNDDRTLTHTSIIPSGSAVQLVNLPAGAGYEAFGTRPAITRYRLSPPACSGGQTYAVQLRAADMGLSGTSAPFNVTVRPTIGPMTVTLVGPATREGPTPGTNFTIAYDVSHASNHARSLAYSAPVTGDLEVVSTSFPPSVACQETRSVSVTYRLRPGATYPKSSLATLRVTDPSGTVVEQSVTVTTPLVLANPTVGAAAGVVADPGTSGTLSYSLRNNSNADRTFTFGYTSGNPSAATVARPPANVTVPAFGTVSMPGIRGGYSVPTTAQGEWRATLTLTARDAGALPYVHSGAGVVTVRTVLANPTITPPATCAAGDPGATGSLVYSLKNNSNVRRTFSFGFASSSPPAAEAVGSPTSVVVEAFGTASVAGSWRIPTTAEGGWVANMTLSGSDAGSSGYMGSNSCTVTVNTVLRSPTVGGGAGVAGTYAQWRSMPFTVTNHSNVERTFTLTPAASNGAIISAFASVGPITLPAFGNTTVQLGLQFSAAPAGILSSEIRLTATDNGRTDLAAAGSGIATRINTDPTVGPVASPNNVPRGTLITGTSNAGDPDGVIAQVNWWRVDPTGVETFQGTTSSFTPTLVGTWYLRAQATDNNGGRSPVVTTAAITVINRAPTAVLRVKHVRAQEFFYDDEVAELSLTESSDPDGDALTASVQPWPARINPGTLSGTFGGVQEGTYSVTGTVTDALGAPSTPATVSIRVIKKVIGCMETGSIDYNKEATYNDGSAICRYVKPPIAKLRLYQDEDNRGSFWIRKWTNADPSGSQPGENAVSITKYEYEWGVPLSRWDAAQKRFIVSASSPWDVATTPEVQRVAYDVAMTYTVCLKVWNEAGLSDDDCPQVEMKRETRARLSWKYLGQWVNHANWDAQSWFGNGHGDHGQQRHTFSVSNSVGDVAIRRAWMHLRLRYWEGSRDNLRWLDYTTTSPTRADPAQIEERCGKGNVESYSNGIWCYEQAWRMEVTPNADGGFLNMYQPFGLGRRGITGENVQRGTAYSEFTLFVEDVNGRVTQETRTRNHSDWRESVDWQTWSEQGPSSRFTSAVTGGDGTTMTLTGLTASSRDGRVMETWFVVENQDGNDLSKVSSSEVRGVTSYEMTQPSCGTITVTTYARDDLGKVSAGESYSLQNAPNSECGPGPGELL